MRLGVPKESKRGETRVAATPKTVEQLIKLGYDVVVEAGAGEASAYPDEAYVDAGATLEPAEQVWASDVVAKVNAPSAARPIIKAVMMLMARKSGAKTSRRLGTLATPGAPSKAEATVSNSSGSDNCTR